MIENIKYFSALLILVAIPVVFVYFVYSEVVRFKEERAALEELKKKVYTYTIEYDGVCDKIEGDYWAVSEIRGRNGACGVIYSFQGKEIRIYGNVKVTKKEKR